MAKPNKMDRWAADSPAVCLRGGERGTCLGTPFRCYAHKLFLFLVKNALFTHIICYKEGYKQVPCFQRGPPSETAMFRYFAFKGAPKCH